MTFATLIINELKLKLGTEPTREELWDLSEFLKTEINEQSTLVDIEKAIWKWVEQKTIQCAWCGNRHMPQAMYCQTEGGEFFCDSQCQKDYQEEHGGAL